MNTAMIGHLVAKDWNFQRAPIAAALVGGLIGLAMLLFPSNGMFYGGVVILITVIISIGIYLVFLTVVHERTQGMLPFVMSLPISLREYTAAKMVANLGLFLAPWMLLSVGITAVVLTRDAVPDGLLPFATVLLLYLLVGYVLTLGVALVAGTEGWTITAMGVSNLGFHGFMYWTSHLPDVAATIQGSVAVWTPSIRWLIVSELLAIAVILMVTWFWQSRKTDFT
jgi:hypothetical protein